MGLPQPAVALTNICSTIFNNTLYTYSANAFQALPLTAGAEWETLPAGESVTGGVCVGSTPADASQAGLFIVGGMGASAGYTGLQKFTYATGQWATLAPETLVTQNRLYHGATYLSDSDKIFMYGGQQDGSNGASTHAFAIQASAPYEVSSYDSSAPPTINPIVLQWSSSEAVVLGGSATNDRVMLFDPANTDLVDSGATLLTPFAKDTTGMQAALITGDDNSKNLYTFDETVSPNQVSRIVLMDANGQPVTSAGPAKRSVAEEEAAHSEAALAARDGGSLTLANWPAYNASLAPTTIRSGFSVAQNSDGLVVLAGGGGSDVLCMFNARSNAWQNATASLGRKVLVVSTSQSSSSSSSSSSTSSSTSRSHTSTTAHPTTLFTAASTTVAATPTSSSSTAAATSTTAAAVGASTSSGMSANTILGIVLGSVGGLAVFILLIYFCVIRRKHKKYLESAHNRRASGAASSEKDSFAFANDSFPVQPNSGGRGTFRTGHQAQDSQGSFSSVAILMGRVNNPPPSQMRQANGIQRNNSRDNNTKRISAGSIFAKNLKSTISKPIPQSRPEPDAMQRPFERGSGAGFAAGAAAVAASSSYGRSVTGPRQAAPAPLELQGQPQPQQAQVEDSGEAARRSSGWNRYWSGGSALNMLGFGSGNGRGSGAGMQSVRGSQRATMVSDVSSTYSSTNLNRITQDSATVQPLEIPVMPEAKPRFHRVNSGSPTIANFDNFIKEGMQGKIERSNSNGSVHSNYSSGIAASVQEAWDPTAGGRPWGADRAPSSAYGAASNASYSSSPAPGAGGKRYVPTGMSRQPQLAMADTSSDMSWLNLGETPSSRV